MLTAWSEVSFTILSQSDVLICGRQDMLCEPVHARLLSDSRRGFANLASFVASGAWAAVEKALNFHHHLWPQTGTSLR